MEIVEISKDKINDIKGLNEPFEIIGKIKPLFVNDEWSYTEELFDDSRCQSYPDEDNDYSEYVDSPYKTAFLAYVDDVFAGIIIVRKDWNKYAFVEDISVVKKYRGKGVGLNGLKPKRWMDLHWKRRTIISWHADSIPNVVLNLEL